MARITLAEGLAALREGKRWWPAELVLRGAGSLLLTACWPLALVAHRVATTPPQHEASVAELGLSAAVVVLLCSGLTLTFVGPRLFRQVPLPPHFARRTDYKK